MVDKSGNFDRNNFRVTPNSSLVPIQVCGSSTFGRYEKIASGLTYNMFISEDYLVNFAGYKRAADLIKPSIGAGRGLFRSIRGGFLIAVINNVVYRLDSSLAETFIGNLNTGFGEVFIDENLNGQICIVDGVNAYIYNYNNPPALVIQTNGVLGSGSLLPSYVCYHNTYFLFGNGNTTGNGAFWYAYAYNTGDVTGSTIVQQTQLALSTKPDTALAVRRLPGQGNNVLVFGSSVCEIWTQVGGNQNYRRNSSINIDYGCLSVSTINSGDLYTAWLGVNENNSPVILVYSGEGIERISTDGIDFLLGSISHPEKSTAIFYRQDGHLFYQLTFYDKKDNLTLIYDFNTKRFFNLSDQYNNYHPASQIVYFNQKTYFISLNNASLYESSTVFTTYNENTSTVPSEWNQSLVFPIPRVRVCESIRKPDSGRFIINSLMFTMAQGDDSNFSELDLEAQEDYIITEDGLNNIISQTGQYLITEDSLLSQQDGITIFDNPANLIYRPRIDLAVSKDSGVTFGNYVSRNLNPLGQRKNIITWNNLGSSNDFTVKFRFWTNGAILCTDGFVELY